MVYTLYCYTAVYYITYTITSFSDSSIDSNRDQRNQRHIRLLIREKQVFIIFLVTQNK